MSAPATPPVRAPVDPAARPVDPTPSQTIGPFLAIGLAPLERRHVVPPGSPGATVLTGRLLDGAGDPVPDAVVEIFQPDAGGGFPEGTAVWSGFGRCLTDHDGWFSFVTCRPGPVALDSGAVQAPHLDVLVFARGLTRRLRTRLYFPDEPANATDPVLAAVPADRRPTLVAAAKPGPGRGGEPDGAVQLRFDVRLQGDGETVFFA